MGEITMTPEEIKRLRELCEKATRGPWFDSRCNKSIQVTKDSEAFNRGDFVICRYPTRTNNSLLSHEEWEFNAQFIAEARTALPRLIDEVERLRAALEKAADIIINNPKGSYRGEKAGSIAAECYTFIREALGGGE